jgi:hypothetical protein
VETDLIKFSAGSTADRVENFDELAALVSLTRFARYLED